MANKKNNKKKMSRIPEVKLDGRRFNGRPKGSKNLKRSDIAHPEITNQTDLKRYLVGLEGRALTAIKKGIEQGDYRFVKLYLEYHIGKPKEQKEITIMQEQPLFNLDLTNAEIEDAVIDDLISDEDE